MNQHHKENVIVSEPAIINSGGQVDRFNCPPTWEVFIKQHHQKYLGFHSRLFYCFFLLPSEYMRRHAAGSH